MALKKCKECGNEISSDAKVCPHCGKKQPPTKRAKLGCLILLMVILIPLLVVIFQSQKAPKKPTRTTTAPKPKIDLTKLKQDINVLIENGLLIRIDSQFNEAFINSIIWNRLDYQAKENIAITLASYCEAIGEHEKWVEIKDHRSGKKLAKYSVWGFKTY